MNFSVLMSVYSRENGDYFDAALKSILINQTIKPNEFVLVCDGPLTNELDNVILKYQTLFPNILKIFRLTTNEGLGKALNYGLEQCTNEIVARADSDDICCSDRFEKQIAFFESNDTVVALGSSIDEFESDPRIPRNIKYMPCGMFAIKKMNKYRNPLNHMTVMFKKSAVISVGSYIHLAYVEDYYLWERLLANGYELENLDEILVHARVGNGMISRRGNKVYIASWKELNKYKMKHKLINRFEYFINIVSVFAFIYTPVGLKQWLYKNILRR